MIDVPRLRAPMSRMTLGIAVDSLALFRALPDDLPRDARLDLIERFVACWMRGQFASPVVRWIYRHRWAHLLLRRWWFWTANLLDEPAGWRFRFLRGDEDLFYGVDVTRCGIVRFLSQQGAPELDPLMCRGDFQITAFLPAGVTFARSQTLAERAPHCDFRYLTVPTLVDKRTVDLEVRDDSARKAPS
ncbi:L-2-amino-thiazoline-4-carboxylic acid hydrolase [Nonomuraea maheshkhaliensis]